MEIKIKYSISQTLFAMNNNKVIQFIPDKIVISLTQDRGGTYISARYHTQQYGNNYTEDQVFPTKQELLDSL